MRLVNSLRTTTAPVPAATEAREGITTMFWVQCVHVLFRYEVFFIIRYVFMHCYRELKLFIL